MDNYVFDNFTRAISAVAPRRGVLAALTGGLLTTLSLAQGEGKAEAKNKKKRKRKKRKKAAVPPAAAPPPSARRAAAAALAATTAAAVRAGHAPPASHA